VKISVTSLKRPAAGTAAYLFMLAAYPALAKLLTLFLGRRGTVYVDQRFQTLMMPGATDRLCSALAPAVLTLLFWGGLALLRRRGDGARRTPEMGLLLSVLPLGLLIPLWFLPLTYLAIPFCILCFALAVGRFVAQLRYDAYGGVFDRRGVLILALFVLGSALWGGFQQWDSHISLGMQWLDWGHYYESLRNTWRGDFFYLNLSHGCFLGSRFCPSMLALSPVLLAGVPGFFFFGALLVASGAFPVYALARSFGARKSEALLFGIWYLLLPGVVNLELPLLDGFHEVFLLPPLVLWALYAYEKKRLWLACALVLFCFGVRETTPFMFLGFGITLFLTGRKRHGVVLAAASLLALVLIIGVLMPLARPAEKTVYDHVTFYPHLGDTVCEIALSPLLRFRTFWGRLFFNAHSWRYYAVLFLPFAFLAIASPKWLIPMIFDLVMVVEDRRFDSQTLLRHYQCVMLITLVVASLESFRKIRSGNAPKYMNLFMYPVADRPANGIMAATLAATLGMTLFFTQLPGSPGADPRLANWGDVRGVIRSFTALMEPGSQVTAGPRLAGFLVDDYDVFLSADGSEPLKRYVFVEGFNPNYRQKELRSKLLADPDWTLLRSEYLDDRVVLIQLFEHKPRTSPLPHGVRRMSEVEWRKCGAPIPSRLGQLEMRWRPGKSSDGRDVMVVSARLSEPIDLDIGFELHLDYEDAPASKHFVSFGNGMLPADSAAPGDVYTFFVPVAGRIANCRVDIRVIGGEKQEF